MTKSLPTLTLSIKFYSNPSPDDPVWYMDNRSLSYGFKYLNVTSANRISPILHDIEVMVDGYVSTLTIRNYSMNDNGIYTFIVRNSFSVTEESIVINSNGKFIQFSLFQFFYREAKTFKKHETYILTAIAITLLSVFMENENWCCVLNWKRWKY